MGWGLVGRVEGDHALLQALPAAVPAHAPAECSKIQARNQLLGHARALTASLNVWRVAMHDTTNPASCSVPSGLTSTAATDRYLVKSNLCESASRCNCMHASRGGPAGCGYGWSLRTCPS